MDAVEYLKEKARMTNGCNGGCNECPLSNDSNGKGTGCTNFQFKFPELAVEAVEKWAKEHPVKTYLSVMLEKLPYTKLDSKGTPTKICPSDVFNISERKDCPEKECFICWNLEYKEEI